MKAALVAGALALVGCAAEPPDGDGPDGGGGADAAGGPDAPICAAPVAAPPWLDAELAATMAALTGTADIAPGVRLVDRSTATARATVRSYLRDRLVALGLTVRLDDYGTGANVIAELPGTAGEPWIVVGAHFDSVRGSPGADDNASGTAATLAIARMLRDTPCRTHGVYIALFDQEEVGLIGSSYYAAELARAATPILAAHTLDMVGYDGDGDRRFEVESPTPALWADYQAAATTLGLSVSETVTMSTDHQAFRDRGFAAVGLSEEWAGGDTSPHYHAATDTVSTLAMPYLALAARLSALTIAREAGAP